ncbi:hypothetical protein BC938DRAFT_474484 [Jimgerdemannia flammicorona]|uniref:WD40-repeat-containing domain protein n=1 Tax=Jimgerdemannia flammicorona TaxID=994334 RepID=A0A433QSH5_9FUNG|nr:hypothetical protein BC938DRAFT_474484 [Jimgerdemannia flammicorona]
MLATSTRVPSLHRQDTEYSADSIEFNPFIDSGNARYFACGTYQLAKNETEEAAATAKDDEDVERKDRPMDRLGRILIYEVVDTKEGNVATWVILCVSGPVAPCDGKRRTYFLVFGVCRKVHQRLECPAVLDMKWSHHRIFGKEILGVVDSIGSLSLYEFADDDNGIARLSLSHHLATIPDISTLCLSLDWSNRVSPNVAARITTSHSSGSLSVISINNERAEVVKQWHAHDFETWIAAWNYWDAEVLYSGRALRSYSREALMVVMKFELLSLVYHAGADDCLFKGWDLRAGTNRPTFVTSTWVSRRSNPLPSSRISSPLAGNTRDLSLPPHLDSTTYTSVHSAPLLGPHVTSYNEHILLWDVRSLRQPISDFHTGGGVWRLRWHPAERHTLLAACMHAGAFVVDVRGGILDGGVGGFSNYGLCGDPLSGNTSSRQCAPVSHAHSAEPATCTLTSSFLDHQSMVYGADWSCDPDRVRNGRSLVATCSFYDHVAHLCGTMMETKCDRDAESGYAVVEVTEQEHVIGGSPDAEF